MRTLQVGHRPTELAQPVPEVGRIDKQFTLSRPLNDESNGPRTLTQLNRGEDHHSSEHGRSFGTTAKREILGDSRGCREVITVHL